MRKISPFFYIFSTQKLSLLLLFKLPNKGISNLVGNFDNSEGDAPKLGFEIRKIDGNDE